MIERNYSSEPFIKSPKRLLVDIYRDLSYSRELAYRLFIRNLSAQYRHSFLGYFWAFVPPIVTALIWIVLQRTAIINLPQTQEMSYPIYVFTGTMLWRCFVDAVNMPLTSFRSAKYMLSKIAFPHEALFLSGLANLMFNSIIRILILAVVLSTLGCSVSLSTLLFPIYFSALLLCGFSIGLLLVPIGMIYDDVSRVLGFALQFLFYLTPVVYVIPLHWLSFNPVSQLLNLSRSSLVGFTASPNLFFIIIFLVSILIFLFGWVTLKITMPHVVERISS